MHYTLHMKFFYTVDTEVWLHNSNHDPERFLEAFNYYILGKTSSGYFGLEFQLQLLQQHGLKGVFFVEPLFARRFGLQPLRDMIDLIQGYGSEVQVHLHPEWDAPDLTATPLINDFNSCDLADYSLVQQGELINSAISLLAEAGASKLSAFRAGNYAANLTTLAA